MDSKHCIELRNIYNYMQNTLCEIVKTLFRILSNTQVMFIIICVKSQAAIL